MTFREVMAEYGYETKTTFWDDFSIADRFGIGAIKDTYKRAFKGWHTSVVYLTELIMVLNHKMWFYYERGDQEKYKVYLDLWTGADGWAVDNLKGEDLDYYYKTTD